MTTGSIPLSSLLSLYVVYSYIISPLVYRHNPHETVYVLFYVVVDEVAVVVDEVVVVAAAAAAAAVAVLQTKCGDSSAQCRDSKSTQDPTTGTNIFTVIT